MLQSIDIKLDSISIDDQTLDLYATKYYDSDIPAQASILYLHGGGLLYGSRKDLPLLHLQQFTQAGFQIISYDYPLAPGVKIDGILPSVVKSVLSYNESLPYFLFGRSAGAYLALLAINKLEQLNAPMLPKGLVSFYGYGFLTDGWYDSPSADYLKLPKVEADIMQNTLTTLYATAPIDTHYSAYIYARQSGNWKSLIYQGRDKFFYTDYSLRLCDKIQTPLFLAHAIGDTDVPFAEFKVLCDKYQPQRFIASSNTHDFDRDETASHTAELLQTTIRFMQNLI